MTWISFFVFLLVVLLILWNYAVFVLAGDNHDHYEKPVGEIFKAHPDDVAAETKFVESLHVARKDVVKTKSLKKGLEISRKFADQLSDDLETDTVFTPIQFEQYSAEWAVAPGCNVDRRLLFLHGGAFTIGSALGHRKFSDRLSRICNAAVLAINYRTLPEHPRRASVKDSQHAYRWIVENSPGEQKPCDFLLVAGDSAGGNLALMLSSWSNQKNLHRPDGVIAFSPSLDSTASASSFQKNRKTDKILGASIGKLSLIPKPMQLWIATLLFRSNPSNPSLSPLFYDLGDLPSTLIHASSSEILLGDAIRYTNKALAAGSYVKLQIWENQIHDWHLFNMGIGSAESAWREVEKFVRGLSD
ncbi:MAG: alpha/beta hydrolase [Acidiferrobacterales bacterium]|nr:alpha/beta hydrolase [Acidiferrobacterales bacterium]